MTDRTPDYAPAAKNANTWIAATPPSAELTDAERERLQRIFQRLTKNWNKNT